ncbi:hypothetical protein GEMRC1_009248 [Eukaryota sp. GEM-RC1]
MPSSSDALLSDVDWLFSPHHTVSAPLTPQTSSCPSCNTRSKKLLSLTTRVEQLAGFVNDISTERDNLLVRLANSDDIITSLKEELFILKSQSTDAERRSLQAEAISTALQTSLNECERKLASRQSTPL